MFQDTMKKKKKKKKKNQKQLCYFDWLRSFQD